MASDPRPPLTPDGRPAVDPLSPDPRVSPGTVDNRTVVKGSSGNGILIAGVVIVLAIIAYFVFAPAPETAPPAGEATTTEPATPPATTEPATPPATTTEPATPPATTTEPAPADSGTTTTPPADGGATTTPPAEGGSTTGGSTTGGSTTAPAN